MFGVFLKQAFDNNVAKGVANPDEITLFSYFQSAFKNVASIAPNAYKVDIIHSKASMTNYDVLQKDLYRYTKPYFNKNNELGDLMFVVYSPKNKKARLSVMQNKYDRKNLLVRGKFELDACQLYLMQGKGLNVYSPLKFINDNILKDMMQSPAL